MSAVAQMPGFVIRPPTGGVSYPELPQSWPPPDDYPIVVDNHGVVISRLGDSTWNLTPWAGTRRTINFGDGRIKARGFRLDKGNARLLRLITAYWLMGPNAVEKVATLEMRFSLLKPIFALCSEKRILASNLSRFPLVIEELTGRMNKSLGNYAIALLHELQLAEDVLGFVVLDASALKLFASKVPRRESIQTAYIPPRIWTYQVRRLKECLDDFLEHRSQVEKCYQFCLKAYATNAGGSLTNAILHSLPQASQPFHPDNVDKARKPGQKFYGQFRKTAERFGIEALLDRWVNTSDQAGIKALSSYLTLVSGAGLAYAMNFSLMRIDEGAQIRLNCLTVDKDPSGQDVHLLCGPTSKTTSDTSARWIVSPSTSVAIEAMTAVCQMRTTAIKADPRFKRSSFDVENPYLLIRAAEPWTSTRPASVRKRPQGYGTFIKQYPKLFDPAQLVMSKMDVEIARQMTAGLKAKTFSVGKKWPLAWHQLRRTGAVNMLSSGLVSDASLQYQLKHLSRAMSHYYAQNYFKLKRNLDPETKGYYIREMFSAVAREFAALHSDSMVSPYGEKRKQQILSMVSETDHDSLVRHARSGRISYRGTFLGGCALPGDPCPLGGISNISGCMGFGGKKPCEWALVDREKKPLILALQSVHHQQLKAATPGTQMHESIAAQIESAERALHVIG